MKVMAIGTLKPLSPEQRQHLPVATASADLITCAILSDHRSLSMLSGRPSCT